MAHCCPWWLAYSFDNPLRRLVQEPRRLLEPHVGPGSTALDVGCGMGFFSLELARLVGAEGRVIAVDLQPQMLEVTMRRARRRGLAERIVPRLAAADDLRVDEPVDFALAMWMVHEVADRERLLRQVAGCLRPGGRLLVAEPRVHVSRRAFAATVGLASAQGLDLVGRARVGLSRAALLERR